MGGPKYVPIVFTADGAAATQVVKGLTSAFSQLDDTAEKTSGGGLRSVFIQADLASRAIATLTREAVDAAREYLQFGKELANLNTLLDDSSALPKLRNGLLDLDPALGHTSELARGMYQAISSGVDAADALSAIEVSAKAARAGLASTFETVDMGTSVMASFGLKGKDLATIYDKAFETVKRGKVEFPQLAQSIGMVSSFAAAAGVSIDELFAAVATGSRTMRPTQVIEGMRVALANIVKPTEDAKKVAQELGIDFSASALKAKGLAGFLDQVSTAAQGDTSKLTRLFGDVQALAFVLSVTGNQTKQFKDDLHGIAEASGVVEEAFQKQKESLAAQAEATKVMFEKGLMRGLMLVEPLLTGTLKLVNQYPGAFAAAAIAVLSLVAAYQLLNTQLVANTLTGIPAVLTALKQTIQLMGLVRYAAAMTATEIAAVTAGWGLLVVAAGVAVATMVDWSSASERAASITAEAVAALKGHADESLRARGLVAQLSGAVETSGDKHKLLEEVLRTLNPETRAYVETITDEKKKIDAVKQAVDDLANRSQTELRAQLLTTSAAILETTAQIETKRHKISELNSIIDEWKLKLTQGAASASETAYVTSTLSGRVADLSKEIGDTLNPQLQHNAEMQARVGQAMGLSHDQFVAFLEQAGYAKEDVARLASLYDQLTASTRNSTDAQGQNNSAVQQGTATVDAYTEALKNAKTAQDAISAGKAKFAEAVKGITMTAPNPKEALRQYNELLAKDPSLAQSITDTKRYEANQRTLDAAAFPSEHKAGGSRTKKIVDQEDKFRLAEVRSIQEFFKAATGRELPISAYGQTPTHNRYNLDHRNSVDVALHPDSALGRLLTEYLRERNIPFRPIREADIARGVKATAPHIHVGEPSHAFGKKTRSVGITRVDDFDGQFLTLGGQFQKNPFTGDDDMTKPQSGGQLIQLTPAKLDGFLDKLGTLLAKMRSQPVTSGTVTPFDQIATYQNSPTQQALVDYNTDVLKREEDAAERRIFLSQYIDGRLREIRTAFYSRETEMNVELAGMEETLAQHRRHVADDQLSEQRRLLAAKSDEIELTQRLTNLQDQYSNSFANLGLRAQVAEWEELVSIKREDVEAIESQARSQVRLADAANVHGEVVRARVLARLAEAGDATTAWSDGLISSFDTITSATDRWIEKLTHGVGLATSLLQNLAHQLENRIFKQFLDMLFPEKGGANAAGGGGSDGGGFSFAGAAKGYKSGGLWGGIKGLFGFGSSAASAAGGAAGAGSSAAIGGLGAAAAASLSAGASAGAAAGGIGSAAGASLGASAGGGSMMASMGALFTNPWTAVVAGSVLAGVMLWRHFRNGTEKKLRSAIQSEYSVMVKDMNVLKSIKEIGEQQFGRGKVSAHLLETIKLDPARELIANYAEATGQKSSKLTTNAQLQDEGFEGNRFIRRITGGPIPGVTRGYDHVPVLADAGEHVIDTATVMRNGGHGTFDDLRAGRATVTRGTVFAKIMAKIRERNEQAAGSSTSSGSSSVSSSRSSSSGGGAVSGGLHAALTAGLAQAVSELSSQLARIKSMPHGQALQLAVEENPEAIGRGLEEATDRDGLLMTRISKKSGNG